MAQKQSDIIEVLNLYKEEGETPLERIERFKRTHSEYKDISMTYAGRLDPMAEGVLLVLAGNAVHEKEKYLGLKKEYEVEVLFGFETDTYDILGKLTRFVQGQTLDKTAIHESLQGYIGKFTQEYPPFSSRTIDGEPLFVKARNGSLPEEMPKREVEIHSLEMGEMRVIKAQDLLQNISERISKVKGDFRQQEILKMWQEGLQNSANEFQIVKIKIVCSSGTYMRSLAHSVGKKLGVPALAFSIKRVKVGDFEIVDSQKE